MGNVSAKSDRIPESFFDDPDSYMDPAMLNAQMQQQQSSERDNNPGTYEELNKLCKDVLPVTFEGGKIIMNKMLSNNFQISHTVNMSTANGNSGYKFGSTYVGQKQISQSESFPVLFGDIDPQGNLNANIVHQITDRVRCKMTALIQANRVSGAQLSTDIKCDDCTVSVTVCNPNIISGSGMMLAHYLQTAYPGLALGAELAYQCGAQVPGGEATALAAAARLENGVTCLSGSLGQSGLHLCYYRRSSDQIQISAELETNFRLREASATIGYQVDLPRSDLIFRGSIDTNWNVSAVLESKMRPLPISFALSGLLNHSKSQFRLGCGIVIG